MSHLISLIFSYYFYGCNGCGDGGGGGDVDIVTGAQTSELIALEIFSSLFPIFDPNDKKQSIIFSLIFNLNRFEF